MWFLAVIGEAALARSPSALLALATRSLTSEYGFRELLRLMVWCSFQRNAGIA